MELEEEELIIPALIILIEIIGPIDLIDLIGAITKNSEKTDYNVCKMF